jgi:hypothetical protein
MVYFGTEAKPYKESEIQDSIVNSVVNRFKERSEVGIAKYGTTMDRKDLSTLEWMIHFREELMDGLLYLERVIQDTKDKELLDTFTGTNSTNTFGINSISNVVECQCR